MGWLSDLAAGVGMGLKLHIIKRKSDLHTIKSYLTLTLVCGMSCGGGGVGKGFAG
jgi:hypothetical protein